MGRKYKDRQYLGVSAGAYPWIVVDTHRTPFQVSYLVKHFTGAGQMSANIEGTHDNPLVPTSGAETSARAFFLVTANPSTGLQTNGVLVDKPCNAIRLTVGAASGASSLLFSLLQAGD